MIGNIACHAPDCTEPVIGQCQGYKEPCGRYYCAKHSHLKLCDECAAIAEAERLYKEYEEKARYVKKTGTAVWIFIGLIVLFFYLGSFAGMLIGGENQGTFISLFGGIGLITGIIIAARIVNNGRKQRLSEICNKNQGFSDFYSAWSKESRNDAFKAVGVVAALVVVGAVAESLSRESQISRDVDRIKNKLDQM